jgi:hypothetical protein
MPCGFGVVSNMSDPTTARTNVPCIFNRGNIMTISYQHYYALTDHEIDRRLAAKRMPPATRIALRQQIMEGKAELKSARAREKQMARLWGELIKPMRREVKIIRIVLNRTKQQHFSGFFADEDEAVAKIAAYDAYWEVMSRLEIKCMKYRAAGMTPSQAAKEKTKLFPHGMPNNGVHWTDWVPPSVKLVVVGLFDAIPRRSKVKRKVPFERKTPRLTRVLDGEVLDMFEEQRFRLRSRTEKDLDRAKRMAQVDPTKADEVARIEQALEFIDSAEQGEVLPTTWHGFYK